MTLVFALLLLTSPAFADTTTLHVDGGEIHLELPDKGLSVSKPTEIGWVTRAAQAVSKYFGRFPVKEVWIEIKARHEGESIGGTTWAGRKIQLRVGPDIKDDRLAKDWTATHEMFHLAFPDVEGRHEWMGEGLATYLEPIARVRAGDLKKDQVWSDMIDGMPKGRPQNGAGLDQDRSWARTYWGGALFWFEADIEIREQTQSKKSLDTAMKAILKAGGDGSETWPEQKIFQECDKATGLTVLRDLYEKMAVHGGDVDLPALWKRLGISKINDHVVYDDKAPLALVRKSLMARSPP